MSRLLIFNSGQRHLLFSCHTGHGGAFFCGETAKKPGYPLQFLSLPAAGLRDFRFNPGCMGEQQFCEAKLRPAPCAPRAFALRAI
jgi:hypothetical protein